MSPEVAKPGLEGVVASDTTVCCVDQGTLLYRGYTIADLAENTTFDEVAHLLLYGELPTTSQLSAFRTMLDGFHGLDPAIVSTIRTIPHDVPMMDVLRTGVSMAGHFASRRAISWSRPTNGERPLWRETSNLPCNSPVPSSS